MAWTPIHAKGMEGMRILKILRTKSTKKGKDTKQKEKGYDVRRTQYTHQEGCVHKPHDDMQTLHTPFAQKAKTYQGSIGRQKEAKNSCLWCKALTQTMHKT